MGPSTRSRVAAAVLTCALVWGCRYGSAPREGSLDSLYASSTSELRQGRLADAVALADRGVAQSVERSHSESAAKFRLLQAEIALFRRDLATARSLLDHPLPAVANVNTLRARHRYLNGQMQLIEGRWDDALHVLGDAARVAAAAGARDVELDARILIGQAFYRTGRWREAERELETALDGAKQVRDSYRQAVALHNLGIAHLFRGRYDAALPYFEQVLAFKELESHTVHATALTNAGLCQARLGEFDRALATFERAVQIHEQRKSPQYLQQALGEMGNAYFLSGRPTEGILRLRHALQVAKEGQLDSDAAIWAASLAAAYISQKQWGLAEQHNAEAARLRADPRNRPYQVINEAQIAEGRGDGATARRRYTDAAEAGRDSPTINLLMHAGLGRLDLAAGKWQDGLRHYESALNIIERARLDLSRTEFRLSLQSRLVSIYGEYMDALILRGRSDLALAVGDSSRARVLAERQGVAAPGRVLPATFRETAAQLQSTLVFYWIGPERSHAWVVTRDRILPVPLAVTAEEVERLVRSYRDLVVTSVGDPIVGPRGPGDELYDKLIAPIAKRIPHGSRVVIVPDAVLSRLNFETLRVPGPPPHYWIEDVEIAVAPSLGSLNLNRNAGSPTAQERSLLLIGDAVPANTRYPALRYASAEMTAISDAFANRASVYRAEKATPSQYLASQPGRFQMVHFTAHADANIESPLDSAVILSRDQTGYKLYARDVAEQPLNAELVTISACRSAGERAYAGEGLVGFAWAFLRAGSKRVIAGLWDVDDRSTAELMGRVYQRIAGGKSPGDALRAAKLEMIAKGGAGSKPYYWGPFELFIGSRVVP